MQRTKGGRAWRARQAVRRPASHDGVLGMARQAVGAGLQGATGAALWVRRMQGAGTLARQRAAAAHEMAGTDWAGWGASGQAGMRAGLPQRGGEAAEVNRG